MATSCRGCRLPRGKGNPHTSIQIALLHSTGAPGKIPQSLWLVSGLPKPTCSKVGRRGSCWLIYTNQGLPLDLEVGSVPSRLQGETHDRGPSTLPHCFFSHSLNPFYLLHLSSNVTPTQFFWSILLVIKIIHVGSDWRKAKEWNKNRMIGMVIEQRKQFCMLAFLLCLFCTRLYSCYVCTGLI